MSSSDENPLIERVDELDVLARAVMRLSGGTHATGAGGVVVLEAAAGLGKTALLEHCARLAADAGCTVRHAAPGPHERQFPFGVIRTLLESPLREASERERASLLSGPAASAGALLLAGADASNLAHAAPASLTTSRGCARDWLRRGRWC